jgi:hypothetical protein
LRLALALALAGALLAGSVRGQACACGVPGLDTALTDQSDTWGVRLAESGRFVGGRFNARGDYRELADNEQERRYEVSALAAFRPIPALELSGLLGYLRDSRHTAAESVSLSGLGDLVLRIRFDAIQEAPRHTERLPWPALAMVGSIRVPTAAANASSGLGLGAWELAQGLVLERSATARLSVGCIVEVGLRNSDTSLGVDRRLGPRLSTQLTAWYWPNSAVAVGLSSGFVWEGDTRLADKWQRGTGMRQALVGAGVVYRPSGSGIRPGLAVRYAPPLHGLVVNATTSTTVELSLAYTR